MDFTLVFLILLFFVALFLGFEAVRKSSAAET